MIKATGTARQVMEQINKWYFGGFREEGDLFDITIKEHHNKRSLNANAYYWVLADKIAKELSKNNKIVKAVDVYREHIKDVGAFYMMPIRQDAVDQFTFVWESNGDGWICEDMGGSKLSGYVVIKAYYGSSTYTKEQMARLIELAVDDAKELGIETMTPEEINELTSLWGSK